MTRPIVAIAVVALLVAGCARTQSTATTGPQFRLEWTATSAPQGAVVRGQLVNGHALAARDIHLLIEELDADGKAVTVTTSVLRRIVLAGERASFDIIVPGATGDRFRVTVVSFDLTSPRAR